jgi:hypothetical protein
MKRYSIMVIQEGSKREVELCQVDNDPHAIAQAAADKTIRVRLSDRVSYIPKYTSVRVIDHAAISPPVK